MHKDALAEISNNQKKRYKSCNVITENSASIYANFITEFLELTGG